jgi:class 3 adenylate cyclase/YHS domain-containing protein
MEQELAILIADLSGYTALTEVHGANKAADLIDTYLGIVEDSLVGSSRLHERAGDEVLILADVADDLLATAVLMLNKSHRESNFLLLHGGLHFGKLLKRRSGYFGTAINFTARIAAKAGAGSIWCSKEFHEAVQNKALHNFESRGRVKFKNMSGEKEVFEIVADQAGFYKIDPVCRMLIISETNALRHPERNDVFFCSQHCMDAFELRKMELTGSSVIPADLSPR